MSSSLPTNQFAVSSERDDDHPAEKGCVGARHRRLDGVGDQQHEDEVEERELAHLALAEHAQPEQQHEVDADRADDELVPGDPEVE